MICNLHAVQTKYTLTIHILHILGYNSNYLFGLGTSYTLTIFGAPLVIIYLYGQRDSYYGVQTDSVMVVSYFKYAIVVFLDSTRVLLVLDGIL